MNPGLSAAAAGMTADERLQQLLANNLANLQTPGFKASDGAMLMFPEMLMQSLQYGDSSGSNIGTIGQGVVMQEGIPSFSEGQLSSTGRSLDLAIVDSTAPGTYALVQTPATQTGTNASTTAATPQVASANGTVIAGPDGRLEVNGQYLAVVDANGNVIPGVFAELNPAFQGNSDYGADGKPAYDANGQPSYRFVNANLQVIGTPGVGQYQNASLRVGNETDMGQHGFFAVAYSSPNVASGVALTRDGHLQMNSQKELVDSSGNPILPVDNTGKPILNARIVVNSSFQGSGMFNPDGSAVIDANGQPSYKVVDTAGNPVTGAKLGTVSADVTKLSPLGQSEWMVGGTLNPTQVLQNLGSSTATLQAGQLEQSNVDPTVTMTQMMAVIAQYQANAQVLQTEASTLSLAVGDVGKVNL